MHNPNRRSISQLIVDLGILDPINKISHGKRSLAEKKLRRAKRKQKRL